MLLAAGSCFTSVSNATLPTDDFVFSVGAYEEALFLEGLAVYACGDPRIEMIAHSQPFLRITNSSNATLFEALELSIGDFDYHFTAFGGVGDLSDRSDITASFLTSAGSPALTDAERDLLRLDFGGSGLAPGETVTYQFQIASDTGMTSFYDLPDFRDVLFVNDDGVNMIPNGLTIISDLPGMEVSTYDTSVDNQANLTDPIGFERTGQGLMASSVNFEFEPTEIPIPEPAGFAVLASLLATLVAVKHRNDAR